MSSNKRVISTADYANTHIAKSYNNQKQSVALDANKIVQELNDKFAKSTITQELYMKAVSQLDSFAKSQKLERVGDEGDFEYVQKGGVHSTHKYLKKEGTKYIYNHDKMTSSDHEKAAKHHEKEMSKTTGSVREMHDHKNAEHTRLGKEKKEKEDGDEHKTQYEEFFETQHGKGVAEVKANFFKRFGDLATDENYKDKLHKYLNKK